MKEVEEVKTTVEQLRGRDAENVSVDMGVLADKLEAIAGFAGRCREEMREAERLVEEMREKLDEKYRDGYRQALSDVRDDVQDLVP